MSPNSDEYWANVDRTGGPKSCWPWLAGRFAEGYGAVTIGGCVRGAHRVAYELSHGPIYSGYQVCHSCDNPICVNPSHLWAGTPGDNMRDCMVKGRIARGERNGGGQKLNTADVLEIRRLQGRLSQRQLARRFAVSQRMIGFIHRRENWAHV